MNVMSTYNDRSKPLFQTLNSSTEAFQNKNSFIPVSQQQTAHQQWFIDYSWIINALRTNLYLNSVNIAKAKVRWVRIKLC